MMLENIIYLYQLKGNYPEERVAQSVTYLQASFL